MLLPAANPFDQFDVAPQFSQVAPAGANPFDQFDPPASASSPRLVPVDHDPFADEMVHVPIVAGRAGVTGYRMVPQSQLDAGTTGALEDAGRVAGNGATLGLLDNAIAGGEAALGSGNYQDNLAVQHADTAQAMQRPGADFLSNSAALAPGMLGVGGAATGAEALGGGLMARLGTNLLGGGISGTNAFSNADGTMGQRLDAAKFPALVGAGLGEQCCLRLLRPSVRWWKPRPKGHERGLWLALWQRAAGILPIPILTGLGTKARMSGRRVEALSNLGPGAVLADTGEGLMGTGEQAGE